MWSLVEANVSIICACLPLLRPLISRLFPSFGKSKSRSKDKSNSFNLRNRHGLGSRGKNNVHDGARTSSWDWTYQTTIVATANTTNHKNGFDDDDDLELSTHPSVLGGITKQTDVEVALETMSERGSQRRLTSSASRILTDCTDEERQSTPSI